MKLELEKLETRDCPSTVTFDNGILSVQGGAGTDWLFAFEQGGQVKLVVWENYSPQSETYYNKADVVKLVLDGGSGGYWDWLYNATSVPVEATIRGERGQIYNRASNSILSDLGTNSYVSSFGGNHNIITLGIGVQAYVTNEQFDTVSAPSHNIYYLSATAQDSTFDLGPAGGRSWCSLYLDRCTLNSGGGNDLVDLFGDHNTVTTGGYGAWLLNGSYNGFHAGQGHLSLEILGHYIPYDTTNITPSGIGFALEAEDTVDLGGGSCVVTVVAGGESTFYCGAGNNTIHLNGSGENTVYLNPNDTMDGVTATDLLIPL